ncbi:hypothetical protein CASFOL_000108 [Castilleja foliolosa]|uniref:Uncharacterized protein n=1 Tax=Castilleja foliolosa TaxID=1961234 RepID=A0ABD3EMQ0_9LAMI
MKGIRDNANWIKSQAESCHESLNSVRVNSILSKHIRRFSCPTLPICSPHSDGRLDSTHDNNDNNFKRAQSGSYIKAKTERGNTKVKFTLVTYRKIELGDRMTLGLVKEHNLEKQMGCIADFLQIIDRHHILRGKSHYSAKLLPPLSPVTDTKSELEKSAPHPRRFLKYLNSLRPMSSDHVRRLNLHSCRFSNLTKARGPRASLVRKLQGCPWTAEQQPTQKETSKEAADFGELLHL